VAMGVYYTSNLPVNNTDSPRTASSVTASQQPLMMTSAPAPTLAAQNAASSVNSTNPITEPSLFPAVENIGQGLRSAPAGFTPHQ
jgi:hypothetical protein